MPSLTRRRFLGLAGAAGVLSGCSVVSAGTLGAAPDPGVTTFWNLWAGSDGQRAQQMYDAYTAEHGSSSLQPITFTWGDPYYTKLSLATLSGRAPDLAVAHVSRLSSLQKAGLIEPIDDATLAAGGLSTGQFSPPAWKAALVAGKPYSLPYDVGPLVLYYNTDICAKAGLLDGNGTLKPLRGVKDFTAALSAATKAGARYGAVWPVIGDPASNWRLFSSFYTQQGGTSFLGEGGRTVTIADDVAASTLQFLATTTGSAGLVPSAVDYAGSLSQFGSGAAGFLINGCWEVGTMQTSGVPFGMTTLPQLFDSPAVWADSHSLVLPRKARSASDLSRTMGFAKSLLDQSLTWAKGGAIPSDLAVLSSPGYAELKPQSNYANTADFAVYDPPAWYSGAGSIFMTITGNQIGLVQQGLASVPDAVSSMRSQLQRYADTPTPL